MDFWPDGIMFGGLVAGAGLVANGFRSLQLATAERVERQRAADRAERMHARELAAQIATAPYQSPFPALTHYNGRDLPALDRAPVALPSITEAPPLALPGVTDLGTVLGTGWRPSAQSILLGLGPGGVPITVPAGDMLCHVAFGGKTGAGKTNLMRLFLTQLCAAGMEVYLCDPHFTPQNIRTQEDWRPIAVRLQGGGPLVDKDAIVALLDGTGAELDRRLARWHAGADPGPARFYAIEELPLLAAYDKEFMPKLGRLLREGRKLGLYVIMASQDLLISTLGGSSGLRAQFQTLYYGGGDDTTRKVMVGYRTPEPPGRGVVYLRSAVSQEPQLVRVPLVTNADIAALLPTSGAASQMVDAASWPVPTPTSADVASEVATNAREAREVAQELSERAQKVRDLVRAGVPVSKIIAQEWGVTGGRGYTDAAQELTGILAQLV
jgi:hypothetical protein